MKIIGLIGGMTWRSSIEYYRIINQLISERLGNDHSGHLILYSLDFSQINLAMHKNNWDVVTEILKKTAISLRKAGADFFLLCTNTMHKIADDIESDFEIPLLNIIDTTANAIKKENIHKIGLIGTKFTMEEEFYRSRLEERFDLEILIPDKKKREQTHHIITDELAKGIFKKSSKRILMDIIHEMIKNEAEGIILGCTEIPLFIKPNDIKFLLFDTMKIHAEAAVELALCE